ncbi:hypothetical protein D9M68_707870 [compost metagenome]
MHKRAVAAALLHPLGVGQLLHQVELDAPGRQRIVLAGEYVLRESHLANAKGVGRVIDDPIHLALAAAVRCFGQAQQRLEVRLVAKGNQHGSGQGLRLEPLVGLVGGAGLTRQIPAFDWQTGDYLQFLALHLLAVQ